VFQIFFILKKKFSHITFLHVYHHSTMAVMSWIGFKFVPGGQSE
jgi:elongation of very long chain fatty acids protein 4